MRRLFPVVVGFILAAAFLAACSGPPGGNVCTNCNPQGDGSLLVTMTASPLTPPPSTSILAFSATIGGISLTPTSGSAINVPLAGSSLVVDLTRLQSDSAFLGSVLNGIPAGTYSNITLAITGASVTYCTQLNPGNPGCEVGSTATVSGGIVAPVLSSSPFPITVSANQTVALRIQINLANTLTIDPATQVVSAVNLGASNVFSVSALPPTASSLASGQSDFIEDFTGLVTSVSGSTVGIQTSRHGNVTAVASSTTFFSPNCVGFGFTNDISCVQVNQLASVDLALNADGTFALLAYDPLETSAAGSDWIEGVVIRSAISPTVFQMVTNDVFLASSGGLIGTNLNIANPVTITLGTPITFGVDTKGLIVPSEALTFSSANDTSVLQPGQTVAVHVASFTPATGGTPAAATVDFVGLRFTRMSGFVFSAAPPNTFSFVSLPPFLGATTALLVQLNQPVAPDTAPTHFDGITDASGLTASQTVSIRALYFGTGSATPFTAAKIRTH